MSQTPSEAPTRWEPSELAEKLKREFVRAKKRKNRWGSKIPEVAAVVQEAAPPAVSLESLQVQVDEINQKLKTMEVTLAPAAECIPH